MVSVSAWQMLRGWFARVGSDPYYASYERSLGNIKAELDRIQAVRAARHKAWAAIRARFLGSFAAAYAAILAYTAYVNQQPHGTYKPAQQAVRVAPAFAAPVLGWGAYRALSWLQGLLDRRAARRVAQLEGKLRKQVTELKDSTRYDRTLALLQKYDPDYAPARPERATPARQPRGKAGAPLPPGAAGPTPAVSRAAGAAVNAAGAALQGAGARMFPVLAQLYSRAAETLIADDPVVLGLLKEAQQQSDLLRQRLQAAEGRSLALLSQNIDLKQRLGLPTEEEQAELAAWASGAGAAGRPPSAEQALLAAGGAPEADAEQDPGAEAPVAAAGQTEGAHLLQPASRSQAGEGNPNGSGSRVGRRRRSSKS